MTSSAVVPSSTTSITQAMQKQDAITEVPYVLDLMESLGLEGLCAGYAMDWLRTRLKAKLFNISLKRIGKMAVRHAKQYEADPHSTESFRETADAYGLIMGHHFDWQVPKKVSDEEWKAPKATKVHIKMDLDPVTNLPFRSDMVYYISLTYIDRGREKGHGFAMDCRGTPWLADWGSGVYECTGMRAQDVFMCHTKLLATNMVKSGLTVTGARCYYVGLKAVKPAKPPIPDKPAIPPVDEF